MTNNPQEDRRLHREEMLRRLKAVLKHPDNQVCSECPERKPTWAILLQPPVEGGMKLGALCCFNCYSYHFRLGHSICTVKSAKMASEWTDEEVQVLEKSGNAMVNSIFEAFLEFPKGEKQDLKTFVENKYQHRDFFSEQVYHEQTTIRDVNRRVSRQFHRSSSGRISNDHGSSHDKSPVPHHKKRPTLNRSCSKRSSRFLLQNMSDHLRKSSTHLEGELDGPTEPQLRRPSAKSRSRERLHAMSDHAKRSSKNLTLEKTSSGNARRPPRRESSTKDDLRAMSDHAKPKRSSSTGRSRSNERMRAMSDHLQRATELSKSPRRANYRRTRSHHDKPVVARSSGHKRHDADFIPPKPRRSFHESELRGLVRQSSQRRVPRLERVEKALPVAQDDLDKSEDEHRLSYNLPIYLAGHRSCPTDLDISDLSSSGMATSESEEMDDAPETQATVSPNECDSGRESSLADYMKRYQQSKSLSNDSQSSEFKLVGPTSNAMPLRVALESLETTMQPRIRSPGSVHSGNTDKAAFWQAKLAPLASNEDDASIMPPLLPQRISTSGRAA